MYFSLVAFCIFITSVSGCHTNTVFVFGKLYSTLSDAPIFASANINCTPAVSLPIALDNEWTIQNYINSTIYTDDERKMNYELVELSSLFPWSAFQLVTAEGVAFETAVSLNGPAWNVTNQLVVVDNLYRPMLCTQQILIVHVDCPAGYILSSHCTNGSHCVPDDIYSWEGDETTYRVHIDFGHIVLAVALFMVLLSSAIFAFRPKLKPIVDPPMDEEKIMHSEPVVFLKKEDIIPLIFVDPPAREV